MKVALLKNQIPPYRVEFLERLATKVELLVVLDTDVEECRDWVINPQALGFKCVIQGKSGVRYHKKRPDLGYTEESYFHLSGAVVAELKSFEPDLIVSAEFGMRSLRAMLYARGRNVPVVIWWEGTSHTEMGESRLKMPVRRLLCRRAAGFFSNGTESTSYLLSLGGDRRFVMEGMTGISTQQYLEEMTRLQPLRAEHRTKFGLGGTVLLFVGSLSQRKGVRQMLDALQRVVDRGVHDFSLLLVGEGDQRPYVEKFSRDNPDVCVRITGFIDPSEIFIYYSIADLFVLPTVLDNWPLVTIEALSCGLPQMISKYNGAASDLGRDSRLGIVMDPMDTQKFSEDLERLIQDPLPRLDQEVVDHYTDFYSPESQARRASELFESIIDSK